MRYFYDPVSGAHMAVEDDAVEEFVPDGAIELCREEGIEKMGGDEVAELLGLK